MIVLCNIKKYFIDTSYGFFIKRFNEAREEALKEMEERAANLGANAVIGVDEIGEVDEMMKKTIKEIVDEQRG
ncbi:hypothetical protein D2962_14525 [Biomaibacter acetigenes]|uniref:Uncharacterized protein n=1 Tax=Biomaibacter acetigenes TaxID=2316383 RepID=A0A3G2R838_9FIRM|nr:hypothetical protein D2962_14525 [Biomaibacter acetigenes]